VPVVSSSGSIVWKPVSDLGQRIAEDVERPTVILYLGDFDPPGLSIEDVALKHAEIQASRWFMAWDLEAGGASPSQAWAEACGAFPRDGTPEDWAQVEVRRLGVVQADLDNHTTSDVKPFQIKVLYKEDGSRVNGSGQYAQWWPAGETRTLQLEALTVPEVVQRVRTELETLIDSDIRDDVIQAESEGRESVRERLAGDDHA
jgi:hypothetical protein